MCIYIYTANTWPDVDQIILKGLKVSRLKNVLGQQSLVIFKPNFVEHKGFSEGFPFVGVKLEAIK